jgi:hypothetical protein
MHTKQEQISNKECAAQSNVGRGANGCGRKKVSEINLGRSIKPFSIQTENELGIAIWTHGQASDPDPERPSANLS